MLLSFLLLLCNAAFANLATGQERIEAVLAYPTGDPASSGLLVHKSAPSEAMLHRAYDYTFEAHNRTDSALFGVVITETLPCSFRIENIIPSGDIKDQVVTWKLKTLSPGARKKFAITGCPSVWEICCPAPACHTRTQTGCHLAAQDQGCWNSGYRFPCQT